VKSRTLAARRSIGVPLAMTHRNEVSAEVRVLVEGRTPCVVGETDEGYEVLLGRAELEACRGDVLCLEAALRLVHPHGQYAGRPVPQQATVAGRLP
jgi:hypothetical protein